MRLNTAQVHRTLSQFEAKAVPDNHPLIPKLNNLFGDHTFFLDRDGLSILEPTDADRADSQAAKVVNLANWSDASRTGLMPHDPASTGRVVALGPKHEA